jgi:hypothetical protein
MMRESKAPPHGPEAPQLGLVRAWGWGWRLGALWLSFWGMAVCVWLTWGQTGFPVGSFWWDELALAGAAQAVQNGMVPAVDFWAPFILPIYLKALAQSLAGLSGGYVLECLLQGMLVLLLLTALLVRGKHAAGVYLVGAWAILQAVLPFNLGTITQAGLGTVAFSGAYNRLGGALITLLLLAMTISLRPSQRGGVASPFVWWVALVLALAFLVKVTVFQLAVVVCVARGLLIPGERWNWWWPSLAWAVVLLCCVLWPTGMATGYLDALHQLSALRVSLWHERWALTHLELLDHRVELVALTLFSALSAWRGIRARKAWVGPVCFYLLCCALLLLYTLSNFGDNGLYPTLASAYLLCCDNWRAEPQSDGSRSRSGARLLPTLQGALLVLGGMAYLTFVLRWGVALLDNRASTNWIHFPVKSEALAAHYQVQASAWADRPPIWVPGVSAPLRSPATYAAYVDGLDEALQFLALQVPDRQQSVYALDFPAYAFALLGGYRIPSHTHPWLLYGHEYAIDSHPSGAQMFADVDVLMISKCSLSGGNRKYLEAIYRLDIQREWLLIGHLRCWDVLKRP